MNIMVKTLEHTPVSDILETFNMAFSNYIVPLQLTEQQLNDKIVSDDIDLKLSAGIFEEDKLIAFVLHGHRVNAGIDMVYNAATGVIPDARGKRLVRQIYDHLLPVFRDKCIAKVTLEVIKGNDRAIRSYEGIGFESVRILNCYKGTLNARACVDIKETIVEAETYDWPLFKSFWDWQPSWQNAIPTIEKTDGLKLLLSQDAAKNTNGYLIFNTRNNRLMQLAVDRSERGKHKASQLLQYVADHFSPTISVMNQDACSVETAEFLLALGLDHFIDQFEMEMKLS